MGDLAAAQAAVAEAFRSDWGRVVAYLIRVTGNWDLAEECAQAAFERALERWPRDGIPSSPAAWLKTTARNGALDRLRRATVGDAKLKELMMLQPSDEATDGDDSGIEDDRLRLMFTCCHPALPVEAQVALTLRTLAGLTTPEIARAFLVPHETMAKRLTRAKRKITEARIPYRVPAAHRLGERLRAVLAVIYALFNEGYGASAGDELIRKDLCAEAIRLGRLLAELMPDEPEAPRAAQPHAPTGLTTSRPRRDHRRARDARGPGPGPVGQGRNRGRMHSARSRRTTSTARALPVAGRDRCLPRAGSERR